MRTDDTSLMNPDDHLRAATDAIVEGARDRFRRHLQRTRVATDRLFVKLFVAQWVFGIVIAVTFSPYAWEGKTRSVHAHVWAATLLGGAIISLPIALAMFLPGHRLTRHVVAVAQM